MTPAERQGFSFVHCCKISDMEYELEIEIALPRNKVVELYDNIDYNYEWQPGLMEIKLISGEMGEVGSFYNLRYQMRGKSMEMKEEIVHKDLPNAYHFEFSTDKMKTRVETFFEERGPHKTLLRTNNIITGSGMVKFFMFLMPGMFKKESFKYMKLFKEFAEKKALEEPEVVH